MPSPWTRCAGQPLTTPPYYTPLPHLLHPLLCLRLHLLRCAASSVRSSRTAASCGPRSASTWLRMPPRAASPNRCAAPSTARWWSRYAARLGLYRHHSMCTACALHERCMCTAGARNTRHTLRMRMCMCMLHVHVHVHVHVHAHVHVHVACACALRPLLIHSRCATHTHSIHTVCACVVVGARRWPRRGRRAAPHAAWPYRGAAAGRPRSVGHGATLRAPS